MIVPELGFSPEEIVRQSLSQVFIDESIEHWMTTPNPMTNGVSPRQALIAGNLNTVAHAVNQIRVQRGCGPWPEPPPGGKIDARRFR